MNNRQKFILNITISISFIVLIIVLSLLISNQAIEPSIKSKSLGVSFNHLYGTDWLGRDMFARTLKGLRLSMVIGLMTSLISVAIALTLGALSSLGNKWMDECVSWLIDLFIGMPHLVFMLLISFVVGGGMKGIILGVGLTHWPSLARLIRAEILKVKSENYIKISKQMGMSTHRIFTSHILPHLLPQILVGFFLLFPHVILHESALTFLGYGLSPQVPSMGIILSEGMRYLSMGSWWLILFPVITLIALVKSFDSVGACIGLLFTPTKSHE